MPKPIKIPIEYAYDTLNDSQRGYDDVYPVDMHDLERIAINNGALVEVKRLRNLFMNGRAFQEFKNALSVPDNYWQRATFTDPSIRPYARRHMTRPLSPVPGSPRRSPSPARRGRPQSRRSPLKMHSKLGELSDDEIDRVDSDVSVMSIRPNQDECDDQDVNLPLPTCKAIRKICRYYDRDRRYMPYTPDNSENKRYRFNVSYRRGR